MQHAASEQIVHFCLETTGAYSQAPALFLAESGQRVSLVNPARVRFSGLAQAQGNKTDKADAALIARFCRQEVPELWRVAAPEIQLLMALMRRLHAVQELAVQEKNRLSVPLIKAHSERMLKAGKPRMVALAACMRKMLVIVYGVLKHQQPFDPFWQLLPLPNPSE